MMDSRRTKSPVSRFVRGVACVAALMTASTSTSSLAAAADHADLPDLVEARRVAIVVAQHNGGPGRAILRHAGSDAKAFRDVLIDVGGVKDDDVTLLVDTDRHAFESALADLAAGDDARAGGRLEVVVYYSGHSDEEGLLFGTERLPWDAFRADVDAVAADVKVVVLDSCASGAAVRKKGGKRRPPLMVNAKTAPKGYAYLTSSSADEASQESDRLGGSYFTYALVSGLRGAADVSGDGRVTLDEAYRFAFHETLARTQTTVGGAQHANFDIQLSGAGELVLTDLRDPSGRLVLADDVYGRVFVRTTPERRLMAEVTKLKGFPLPLALPPGGYDVVVVEGVRAARAQARVTSLGAIIDTKAFEPVDIEEAIPRGLLPITHFPINLGFVSPLEINSYAPRVENNLGLSLLFGRSARMVGAGLAVGGNFVDERLVGALFGFGFNGVSGPATGALLGGSNLALSDVDGAMGGIFINIGMGRTTGAAWALTNVNRELVGAQIGLVNVADEVTGLQLGLVNIAGRARGAQVGLVNIAHHSDAPVGIASLVGDGQAMVGVTASDFALIGLEAKLGSKHVYTRFTAGGSPLLRANNAGSPAIWQPVASGGLGATLRLGESLIGPASVDVDAGVGVVGLSPFVAGGLRLRVRPTPLVSLSVGPEVRFVDSKAVAARPWATAFGDTTVWPGVVVGASL
jgi:hypothetical protein